MTEDAERARKMAREAVERYPNGGLHTVARWALELDAEVGHLRAALEHIRHVCRIGASPEWACRAAREEADAALGEQGTREEPSDGE